MPNKCAMGTAIAMIDDKGKSILCHFLLYELLSTSALFVEMVLRWIFFLIRYNWARAARVGTIGGSKGAPWTPPSRSKFFHIHVVFGKKLSK